MQITVALVQQPAGPTSREAAHEASRRGIVEAHQKGAKLVILPELHAGPYFPIQESPSEFELAETIPGPTTQLLGQLAKEYKLVIVGSVFEKRAPGLYHNTAVVFDTTGEMVGYYRKMHIPDDPGFYEKFYFTPGDGHFDPIDTSIGRLGILVCWDQWFPEAARLMALKGAEMLIYPTAIGWVPQDFEDERSRQRDAWMTIQRSHSISNGLPVLVCNRVRFEADPSQATSGSQFWGSSFVAGPQGEILAQASTTHTETLICELNLTRTEEVRRMWPFLRDRRIDEYEQLTQRYLD